MEQTGADNDPANPREGYNLADPRETDILPTFTAEQVRELSAAFDAMEAGLEEDSRRAALVENTESRVRRFIQWHFRQTEMKICKAIADRVSQYHSGNGNGNDNSNGNGGRDDNADNDSEGDGNGDDMAPFEEHIAKVAASVVNYDAGGSGGEDSGHSLRAHDTQWAAVRGALAQAPGASIAEL